MKGGNVISIIRQKLYIQEIEEELALRFIYTYHYSRIMPRLTKKYIGFFYEERLLGVVTLGWGTQPLQSIRKIFYKHKLVTVDYLEIGKMCFSREMNHNQYFGSMVLSMLIKWMREHMECLFLYTLADGIMGKPGYVYQAGNFQYIGKFKTSVYRNKYTGEKIHPRSARVLLEENARFDGVEKRFWLTHDFCEHKGIEKINGMMFRYVYPLAPKAREILKCYPEYADIDYPKEKDLIYERRVEKGKFERIQMPEFDMKVCEYNYQKFRMEKGSPKKAAFFSVKEES